MQAISHEQPIVDLRNHEACAKCAMPLLDQHLTRCPKCGIPRVPATRILSDPLQGRPWASVEARPAHVTQDDRDTPHATVSITITSGERCGKTLAFANHQTMIAGRCPKNDICLDDEYVSWHHFMLEINPPWVCLRDLGSLNGVYVNRVRLNARNDFATDRESSTRADVTLRDGDTLVAGLHGLRIDIQSSATKVCPTKQDLEPFEIPGFTLHNTLRDPGVGRAYRATRHRDQAHVLLKVLNPDMPLPANACAAVSEKLHTVHMLQFPHLARVEDAGIHDGWCWTATKLKMGHAGRLARARGGRIHWKLLVPILMQALKGLAYAHNMGIVHHDLQPSSILIRKEKNTRFVQIRDAGLAQIIAQHGMQRFVLLGDTPRNLDFTPRERITRFRKTLPASDVWSMAACAYFLLTGVPPRHASADSDPISTVLEADAVPIADRGVDVPPVLLEVLEKALAPDPSNRYSDAEAFRDALKAAAQALDIKSGAP